MILRTIFERGGSRWVPEWRLCWGMSWTHWLVGISVERHANEWTTALHVGPVLLQLERVKSATVLIEQGA